MCGAALLITCAVIGLQMSRRAGVYDPEWVGIFERLFLFQDYPASFVFLGICLIATVPAVQRTGSGLANWLGIHPGLASALVLGLLAVGARYVYMAHPLAMDES